jgi:hypothetical protein
VTSELGIFDPAPDTGYLLDNDTGYFADNETGWFGSKLVKSVSRAVGSVAKSVVKVAVAPLKAANAIAHGQNVAKSVSGLIKDSLPPKSVLKIAAQYAGNIPGVGTAVAVAAGGLGAALEGKSLSQIARGAAIGAIPGGPLAQGAVNAAANLVKAGVQGQNLIKAAAHEAVGAAVNLVPDANARAILQKAAAAGLSGKNILTAVERAAVDRAIGMVPADARHLVQSAVNGVNNPQSLLGAAPGALLGHVVTMKPGSALEQALGHAGKIAMPNRPELVKRPGTLGPQMNVARRGVFSGPNVPRLAPQLMRRSVLHRPLPNAAKAWLRNVAGFGDVGALQSDGTWLVTKGDTGSKIAKALTGNAGRWTELKPVNPKIMGRSPALIKQYGFPIYVNDIVYLPSSWVKTQPQSPTNPVPNAPTIVAPQADLAAMGVARTELVAWGKTDGANQPGVADYGTPTDLMAQTWTARDKYAAAGFENWWNKSGFANSLPTDGEFGQPLVEALYQWTTKRAQTPVTPQPTTPSQPTQPSTPSQPTQPTIVLPTLPTVVLPTVDPSGPATPTQPNQPSTPVTPSTPIQPGTNQPAAKEPMSVQTKGIIYAAAGTVLSIVGPHITKAVFGV